MYIYTRYIMITLMSGYDIETEKLGFGYNDTSRVLQDVDLKVKGHQMISIIGPNGVGKSTLIYCLNKILDPSDGKVFISDKELGSISIKELAKQMGFVPHATHDVFPMTVMDTVLMGRHPHSGHKITDNDVQEAYGILKLLGMEKFAMRSFDQLSAGQHQKIVLARGLAQKPKILLLDEPTSNLDIKHQMDVTRILKELSTEQDMTVIMISHDLNIAARYSDRIIMLFDKGIYRIGTPEEVINEENIRHVYGVESKVIEDSGRPYVILRDSSFTPGPSPEGSVCCR